MFLHSLMDYIPWFFIIFGITGIILVAMTD